MSVLSRQLLDGTHAEAYSRNVEASPPDAKDGEQVHLLPQSHRRRPAQGLEAARRKAFGAIYGKANAEAGKKVREDRGE